VFKQQAKVVKRLTFCTWLKHIFNGNKKKCLCKRFYKSNGRIYYKKGDTYVAGNSPDFTYKRKVVGA
jgi:hypothetical protein